MAAKTVTLADLTRRLGLPDNEQQGVAAYMNESGPWTEEEATELTKIWRNDRSGGSWD